ncbi:hypothetical protein VW23_003720 [Devosia insulae DS-56]|uniref:YdhG-like domain-containing protein n=1 Tax=Devosia insulae DS-56 TaxID=1116389 RepID=A0A1E5XJ04_9HYPH|nr:DUF1801 domain-containing protein [Devosia insulae]OEO28561.1 hypothetical protein VW23_003720 [Devosia insulae DS-56]
MAEQKTVPTTADVGAFLAAIEQEQRRADAARLVELMYARTGEPPQMWSGGIVGFGQYHYRYASGHEGDSCLVGFSPRKSEFSIYLVGIYFPDSTDTARLLLDRLGKHRMGKACLYVKRLSDIDEAVLGQLVTLSVTKLREHYAWTREPLGKH